MTDATEPVIALWRALARRDWDAVKSVVSDDCIFLDVAVGADAGRRGDPTTSSKRLKGGLENEDLADWANRDVLLLTNGTDVMYEHLVTYTSTNGEVTNNPIVSVHKVSDGNDFPLEGLLGFQRDRQRRMVSELSGCGVRYESGCSTRPVWSELPRRGSRQRHRCDQLT